MRPDDELWSRLLWLRASNAELAHAVVECRAVQAETRSSSRGTANHPTRFPQYTKNVIALHGFERGGAVSMIRSLVRMLQLSERYLETGTAGQDNASLDQVLQLSNVARPVVSSQSRHCVFRNALDTSLHLLRKFVRE